VRGRGNIRLSRGGCRSCVPARLLGQARTLVLQAIAGILLDGGGVCWYSDKQNMRDIRFRCAEPNARYPSRKQGFYGPKADQTRIRRREIYAVARAGRGVISCAKQTQLSLFLGQKRRCREKAKPIRPGRGDGAAMWRRNPCGLRRASVPACPTKSCEDAQPTRRRMCLRRMPNKANLRLLWPENAGWRENKANFWGWAVGLACGPGNHSGLPLRIADVMRYGQRAIDSVLPPRMQRRTIGTDVAE
jgi:hypothetical protein